jgi:hypothetical protein
VACHEEIGPTEVEHDGHRRSQASANLSSSPPGKEGSSVACLMGGVAGHAPDREGSPATCGEGSPCQDLKSVEGTGAATEVAGNSA